ncbi:MAG: FUN14 domain-containing protein [Thermoproteales archaeon]|nr:FUN14 domain-containing protein [Thermoproteales archaeon]RLE66013.1 MAG: hypothetical protein DRJ47_03345 [Thermoprotei archaeon]
MQVAEDPISQLLPILVTGSAGLTLGFLIGYALKKLLKMVAVILGLFLLALLVLNFYGLITVNHESLEKIVVLIVGRLRETAPLFVNWVTTSIPFSGGLLAGLILGWKKG